MSSTSNAASPASASSSASATITPGSGLDGLLSASQSQNGKYQNITIGTFMSSLGGALVIFAVQILVFLILKGKLPRI